MAASVKQWEDEGQRGAGAMPLPKGLALPPTGSQQHQRHPSEGTKHAEVQSRTSTPHHHHHHRRLRHHKEVPEHLQFNRFVLTGYRPEQTWKEAVLSIFQWHNETLNIFTHGLGLIVFAAFLICKMNADSPFYGQLILVDIGGIICMLGSVVYHSCMTVPTSKKGYAQLLQADCLGIIAVSAFGAYAMHAVLFPCSSSDLRLALVIIPTILSVIGVLIPGQPVTLRALFLSLIVLLRMGLTMTSLLRMQAFHSHRVLQMSLLSEIAIVLGGLCNSLRIPDRYFPGRLDVSLLNSHTMMHMLTLFGMTLTRYALGLQADFLLETGAPCLQHLASGGAGACVGAE